VVEADEKPTDIYDAIVSAIAVKPNLWFETPRGYRVLYIFDREISLDEYRRIADVCVFALPGADTALVGNVAQGNRLPSCIRTTPTGHKTINHKVWLTNGSLLDPALFFQGLPPRLEHIIGGSRALTPAERQVVEDGLDAKGITPPTSTGKDRYDDCPDAAHNSPGCCIAERYADGTLSYHCFHSSHGPKGKHYTEMVLYEAVTGVPATTYVGDPLRDVPLTIAGERFVRYRLQEALAGTKDAVLMIDIGARVWEFAYGFPEYEFLVDKIERIVSENVVKPEQLERLRKLDYLLNPLHQRLRGIDKTGPFHLYYDEIKRELRKLGDDGCSYALNITKAKMGWTNHAHEWAATTAYTKGSVQYDEEACLITVKNTKAAHADSHMNKASVGIAVHLQSLGIGKYCVYHSPAAFVFEEWRLNDHTGCIEASLPPAPPTVEGAKQLSDHFAADVADVEEDCDALKFFLALYRADRLPFASENDCRIYVMWLAAPLLRDLIPGQIGGFWPHGPSGSGKGYCRDGAERVWENASPHADKISFELALTKEEERRKSFAMAGDALFCIAKEAKKNDEHTNLLIRYSTERKISVRGNWVDEQEMLNRFVYIADSVEEPPDLREVHRRFTTLHVYKRPDQQLANIEFDIEPHGAAIIDSLKTYLETKTPEWFKRQWSKDGRPFGTVALAKMFGVKLAPVTGKSLDELFEAMHEHAEENKDQAEKYRAGAADKKVEQALKQYPSHSLGTFVSALGTLPKYRHLASYYKYGKTIVDALSRETDIGAVAAGKKEFLEVNIGGQAYAFKLGKQNSRFILVPADEYRSKAGAQSADLGGNNETEGSNPTEDDAKHAEPVPPASVDDAISFDTDDLLNTETTHG
jgi:hypothetical protein